MLQRATVLLLCGLFLLSACPEREAEVKAVAEGITHAVPRAGVSVELTMIRSLLQTHRRMHGTLPDRIEAIEGLGRLQYAAEYVYDPAAGTVQSRSYPEL